MDQHTVNGNCLYTYIKNNETDELIDCNEPSIKNNNLCESHQIHMNDVGMIVMNRKYCINQIKKFLHNNEISIHKTDKIVIVTQLFDFLITHKYFLFENNTFCDTIISKLYEFDEEHGDIFDSQKYMRLLFPKLFVNDMTINNVNNDNDNDSIIISI